MIDLKLLAQYEADSPAAFGKVGYRFRKQFNEGWYDGIVVKVLKRGGKICVRQIIFVAQHSFLSHCFHYSFLSL